MPDISSEKLNHLLAQINKLKERTKTKDIGINMPSIDSIPVIAVNKVLQFGVKGEVNKFLKKGWGKPENAKTWSTEAQCEILFRLPSTSEDLIIEFTCNPFLPKGIKEQTITLFLNNKPIASWSSLNKTYSTYIFKSLLPENSVVLLKLVFDKAISPKQMQMSSDSRKLGFSFKSMSLQTIN